MKAEKPKWDLLLEMAQAKIELALLRYKNWEWLHTQNQESKKVGDRGTSTSRTGGERWKLKIAT